MSIPLSRAIRPAMTSTITLPCGVTHTVPAERGSGRRIDVTFAGEDCGFFFLPAPCFMWPGPYTELRVVAQALVHQFPEHRFHPPVLGPGEEPDPDRRGPERELLNQYGASGDHASMALADASRSGDPALVALAEAFLDLHGRVQSANAEQVAAWNERHAA